MGTNTINEILEGLSIDTLKAVIEDISKIGSPGLPKVGRGKEIDWFLLDAIECYNGRVPADDRIEVVDVE